jgi:2-haloacid dehalogenase
MSAPGIRAVLYDYGNVLVGWSPKQLYARLIPDPARLAFFLDHVCPMSWHLLHDQGRPMSETIPERQALYPEFASEIAAWKTGFAHMITGPIMGSVALVEALSRAHIPQYVLTNMPDEMVDVCFSGYEFPRHFSDIIVSGREKIAKPDDEIFQISLRRMGGLAPGEVLFTDDSPANIAAASTLGFHAHLFETPEGLAKAMRDLGLPV